MTSAVPAREHPGVLALVVTRGVTPWLPETLRDLAGVARAPERVVIAVFDPGAVRAVADLAEAAGLAHADVVPVAGASTFGAAARAALTRFPATRDQWLWLLHDDSAPARDSLAALLAAAEQAQSVVLVGAKSVEWARPDELISVGVGVTGSGRRFTALEESEIDQGQYDDRSDVLAVSLAGALMRRDVWDALDGPDPALGPYGDGADLARRSRLAGHRVVVAPRAVVRHARASYQGQRRPEHGPPGPAAPSDPVRSWSGRRKALLHSRLVSTSPVASVLAFVAMFVLAPVRALGRLATKDLRLIGPELRAPFVAAAGLGAVARARRKAAETATLPRRVLRPLQVGPGAQLAVWRDRRLQAAAARRSARTRSELEIAEAAALSRRRRWALLGVFLATTGVAAVALAPLVAAGPLTGGGLLPETADVHSLWRDAFSPWLAVGDGHATPAQPLLVVLAAVTTLLGGLWGTPVSVAITFLLVGAAPLAALGAWFAAGAATRSRAARAWAALAWALLPPLLLGVSQGRIGAVVAHVALPWVALCVARALGVQARDVIQSGMVGARRVHEEVEAASGAPRVGAAATGAGPSVTSAAAGALALAVAAAGAPVLLPLSILAVAVLLAVLPRSVRGRGLLLLLPLPALALLGPWLSAPLVAIANGTDGSGALELSLRRLLGEGGLPAAYVPAEPWQALALWPSDPASEPLTAPLSGSLQLLAIAAGASVVLAAAVALLRPGPRAGGVRIGWVVGLIGLAAALALPLVPAGVGAAGPGAAVAADVADGGSSVVVDTLETQSGALSQPVALTWPGPALSVLLLGLLIAGTCATEGTRNALTRASFGWRQTASTALGLVLAAGVGLAGAGWVALLREPGALGVHARGPGAVPALGLHLQTSPAAARVLSIVPTTDGLDVQLWREDGPQLLSAALAPDTLSGPLLAPSVTPPDAAAEALAVAVSRLTVSADEAVPALTEHAVAAIVVPPSGSALRPGGDETAAAALAAALDGTAGLERVTTNATGTVWRVVTPDGVARARVLTTPGAASDTVVNGDDGGDLPPGGIASDALGARATLEPDPTERVVVLAERAATAWRATLDGATLAPVDLGWYQAWTLPAGASGDLRIDYHDGAAAAWGWAQIVVFSLVGLLALPTRRREVG